MIGASKHNANDTVSQSALDTPWMTVSLKEGPLSLCKLLGSPNLGMTSETRICITSKFFSILQRKDSTQLVKVSTHTSRYCMPLNFGMWMKSSCQFSPGYLPLHCMIKGTTFLLRGLFFWQISQVLVICWTVFRFLPVNSFCTFWWVLSIPKWKAWRRVLMTFHWLASGMSDFPSCLQPSLEVRRPSLWEGPFLFSLRVLRLHLFNSLPRSQVPLLFLKAAVPWLQLLQPNHLLCCLLWPHHFLLMTSTIYYRDFRGEINAEKSLSISLWYLTEDPLAVKKNLSPSKSSMGMKN